MTQTLRGAQVEAVEIRLQETSRGAFIDGEASADPAAACWQGSVVEEIAGTGYFSPYFSALNPRREFVLIATTTEEGAAALAFALPHRSDDTKKMLRRLARAR